MISEGESISLWVTPITLHYATSQLTFYLIPSDSEPMKKCPTSDTY